ncbi:unnamed protein product [Closterium sp. NIES-53]
MTMCPHASSQVKRCIGEAEIAMREIRAWLDTLPPSEDAPKQAQMRSLLAELESLVASVRASARPSLSLDHPTVLRVQRLGKSPDSWASAEAAAAGRGSAFPGTVVVAPLSSFSAASSTAAAASAPAAASAAVAGTMAAAGAAERPDMAVAAAAQATAGTTESGKLLKKPALFIGGSAAAGAGGVAPTGTEENVPPTPFVISGGIRRPVAPGFKDKQSKSKLPPTGGSGSVQSKQVEESNGDREGTGEDKGEEGGSDVAAEADSAGES